MDRARQITVSIQAWMRFGHPIQLASADGKTKSIPRYFIGCQLPADTMAWLEDKNADMQTEMVIWWVVVTKQDERSRFGNETTWTKSPEMYQTWWTSQSVAWITDIIMSIKQALICKKSNLKICDVFIKWNKILSQFGLGVIAFVSGGGRCGCRGRIDWWQCKHLNSN